MLIVQRLYIKDFFKVFLILIVGISLIFSIFGLIDKLDDFAATEGYMLLLLKYALFNVPKYINYILPMTILISCLFIFSMAFKRKEIIIIKLAGAKITNFLKPFLIVGFFLTLFSFFLSEILNPYLSAHLLVIKAQITKKSSNITFKEGSLYMKGKDGSVIKMNVYLEDKDEAYGVNIYIYDEEGLKEKIEAERGLWDGKAWSLKDVKIFEISTGKTSFTEELYTDKIDSPKILKKQILKTEEMTIVELIRYYRKLNDAGFKNQKLLVDISSRFSYPLTNFFMMILGLAISMGANHSFSHKFLLSIKGHEISGGGFLTAAIGLLISIIYWFGHSFFLSLGYAGTINPTISAWVMPLIFALTSIYLFRSIPQ
ncbi:MAG: LptF/LptG family permease [Thermodesulfovibrionales bacterium]|nr:LptF/LptG family permease [Thermodesulfovibrionales bacterium]